MTTRPQSNGGASVLRSAQSLAEPFSDQNQIRKPSRRGILAALVTAVPAAVIASPTIGGTRDPDAELIALAVRYSATLASLKPAEADNEVLYNAYEAARQEWLDPDRDDSPRVFVPDAAGQARCDEIVAAWDAWVAAGDALAESTGLTACETNIAALHDEVITICDTVMRTPSQSFAGLAAKEAIFRATLQRQLDFHKFDPLDEASERYEALALATMDDIRALAVRS